MQRVPVSCSKGHLIALDIIRGLVFLHSNKVVHADLKAKNVLLTQNAGELVALYPSGSGLHCVQLMYMQQTQAVDWLLSPYHCHHTAWQVSSFSS